MAYHPMQIHRVSTYGFLAGRPVFLLRSPEGVTWVMQTYTNHKATDLTEADLPGLGARLDPARGLGVHGDGPRPGPRRSTTNGLAQHRPGRPGQHVPGLHRRREQLRPMGVTVPRDATRSRCHGRQVRAGRDRTG